LLLSEDGVAPSAVGVAQLLDTPVYLIKGLETSDGFLGDVFDDRLILFFGLLGQTVDVVLVLVLVLVLFTLGGGFIDSYPFGLGRCLHLRRLGRCLHLRRLGRSLLLYRFGSRRRRSRRKRRSRSGWRKRILTRPPTRSFSDSNGFCSGLWIDDLILWGGRLRRRLRLGNGFALHRGPVGFVLLLIGSFGLWSRRGFRRGSLFRDDDLGRLL